MKALILACMILGSTIAQAAETTYLELNGNSPKVVSRDEAIIELTNHPDARILKCTTQTIKPALKSK